MDLSFKGATGMRVRQITCAVLVSALLGGIQARLASQNAGASSTDCTVAAVQAKAPKGTTITGATVVPADGKVPQYCRVEGHVAVPGNDVRFRLGLPNAWNGKYYFVGVGGLGGTIGNLDAGL